MQMEVVYRIKRRNVKSHSARGWVDDPGRVKYCLLTCALSAIRPDHRAVCGQCFPSIPLQSMRYAGYEYATVQQPTEIFIEPPERSNGHCTSRLSGGSKSKKIRACQYVILELLVCAVGQQVYSRKKQRDSRPRRLLNDHINKTLQQIHTSHNISNPFSFETWQNKQAADGPKSRV